MSEPNLWDKCDTCGETYGEHSHRDSRCPSEPGAQLRYRDTKFKPHEHDHQRNDYCGAKVCACGDHKGLARCFCGWARDGGNGRQQLIDMGERIDEDDP